MAKGKRPKIISYIAYGRIIGTVFSLFMIFAPSIKRLGDFVPMGLGILLTLQFISCVGLLHMKRWGVHLLVIVATSKLLFQLSLDIVSFNQIMSLLFSIAYISILAFHYKKMDTNL